MFNALREPLVQMGPVSPSASHSGSHRELAKRWPPGPSPAPCPTPDPRGVTSTAPLYAVNKSLPVGALGAPSPRGRGWTRGETKQTLVLTLTWTVLELYKKGVVQKYKNCSVWFFFVFHS